MDAWEQKLEQGTSKNTKTEAEAPDKRLFWTQSGHSNHWLEDCALMPKLCISSCTRLDSTHQVQGANCRHGQATHRYHEGSAEASQIFKLQQCTWAWEQGPTFAESMVPKLNSQHLTHHSIIDAHKQDGSHRYKARTMIKVLWWYLEMTTWSSFPQWLPKLVCAPLLVSLHTINEDVVQKMPEGQQWVRK